MKKKVNWTPHKGRIAQPSTHRVLRALSASAVLCMASGAIYAQQATPQVEDTVVVKGKALKSSEKAKAKLDEVPGGTSLVGSDTVEKGRASTNEDVLAYQPGVFAQAAGGADGLKISIRGSGINRGTNFFRSGVLFMFDGLPVTGPGGTPYELFEPLGLSYTEILRGANAFDYGALTLGGAINYVTKTGYDAAPFEVRLEGGSFGYRKEQVSFGKVIGALDYYVSLTDSSRDGYQAQSKSSSRGIVANIGYKINPDLDTRFYFRYRETKNQQPGLLTREQIAQDPSQANATNVALDSARNQPGSTWIGNKTTLRIDDVSKLEVGFNYHDYPIDQQIGISSGTWGFTDVSLLANYSRSDTLWGKASNTKVGVLFTKHLDAYLDSAVRRSTGINAGVPVGTLYRHADYGGSDTVLHASNDLEIAPSLWLTSGLSAIHTERSTQVTFPSNEPYSRSTNDLAPRIGLRYNITPDVQIYGNASRSVEPPNSWAFLTPPPSYPTGSGPLSGAARRGLDLKDQKANTLELGARGKAGKSEWSLSAYRSLVKNELLSVEIIPASLGVSQVTAESNASATIHQGVEASLANVLWEAGGQRISLRQAYTFNDFKFKNDSKFGKNELPGIPRHFYQAELQYAHTSGFYVGVNTQAAAGNYADYANKYRANGYTLFGASAGFEHPTDGWKVFLDLRNLGDKHYASSTTPLYSVNTVADQARFAAGDGFGAFAGVSYAFK
ncbi:MAG: TonB-dependent receptor [Pseudomonadota bacterium]